MRIGKSTVRFILVLYFILLFSFVAYLGDWGDWKQDKYSETVHRIMEEQEGEEYTVKSEDSSGGSGTDCLAVHIKTEYRRA